MLNPHDAQALYRIIAARRDVRHFIKKPIDPEMMDRLLMAMHQAPSVGLSQPWRIVRITNAGLKTQLIEAVERERLNTAQTYTGEKREAFLSLKVHGLHEADQLLVVCLTPSEADQFGRRTLPEMSLASASCAIQNLWLASRAEGLGMGWVSMFDPKDISRILTLPNEVKPIAIISIGHVDHFYPRPMLEQESWRKSLPLTKVVMENQWTN